MRILFQMVMADWLVILTRFRYIEQIVFLFFLSAEIAINKSISIFGYPIIRLSRNIDPWTEPDWENQTRSFLSQPGIS